MTIGVLGWDLHILIQVRLGWVRLGYMTIEVLGWDLYIISEVVRISLNRLKSYYACN